MLRSPRFAPLLPILFLLFLGLLATPVVAEPTPQPVDELVPMACYAPGADKALVQKAHSRFWDARLRTSLTPPDQDALQKFTFADGDRWSQTATDGGGLGQGDSMTLTWSIVPDGTSIFGYNEEPTSPSNLINWLNGIYGSQAVWLPIFQGIFDSWGSETGVTYVYEPNDDGSPWTSTAIAAGQLGVRGDLRISGHFIDGNSNVLAYNFFPDFGDMVIDTGDNFYNNTSNNSLGLRNVLTHEHGHGLGLAHVCPVNETKLMEPFVSFAFDGVQFDDRLATNRGYGDNNEPNDTPGIATNLGSIAVGNGVSVDSVSIDDNSDTDIFAFTVSGSATVNVTVTPLGSTYLSGPQNTNGSCSAGSNFNALDNQNLNLAVLDTNGSTTLASADATGAGSAESLSGVSLSGAGTYYVEVGGPNNEAQLYDLTVNVSAGGGGGGGNCDGTNCIDWDVTGTVSFSNQDNAGNVTVQNGGDSILLQDNTWRRTTQTFAITADTVVEFDFSSNNQGEIHGIGFDEDNSLSSNRIFKVHGTQNYGITDFDNYAGGTTTYTIPVGQYFTGSSFFLVLVNDNDAGTGNDSTFSNVRVFEDNGGGGGGGCSYDNDFEGGDSTGWVTSGTCSTGTFVLGNPTLESSSGVTTQPNGSASGSNSLFTAINTSVGNADVDGGNCIVTLSGVNAGAASTLSYNYFHGQRDNNDDPGGDFFNVQYRVNGGAWQNAESIGDSQTNAAWTAGSAGVGAGTVDVRVQCSDGAGPGDIVECGIDDVSICEN